MTEETQNTNSDENIEGEVTFLAPEHEVEAFLHTITIGELLRTKREEKGLYLKNISQQTKIHMGLLEHLENNNLDKLPSKIYVRGFVKSTAKLLDINQDVALQALESTYQNQVKSIKKEIPSYEMRNETARNTLSSMVATPLETVRSMTASSSTFIAKGVVAILIIGVVGFNIKNLMDRSEEEHLKLPPVLSTIQKRVKSKPKPVVPSITSQSIDAAKAEATPMKVNIIQDTKDENVKTELSINNVGLKSISLGDKQFTEDKSVVGAELDEIFPSRYRVLVSKGIENVFINAVSGDCWITYKVDEKDVKKYVLRQGRSVFLRGSVIRLFIGNTNSVKFFYNNQLVKLNTKTGVKNLVLPEELKTKYMSPLFVFQKDGTAVTSEDLIKENQKIPEAELPKPGLTNPISPAVPKKPLSL